MESTRDIYIEIEKKLGISESTENFEIFVEYLVIPERHIQLINFENPEHSDNQKNTLKHLSRWAMRTVTAIKISLTSIL